MDPGLTFLALFLPFFLAFDPFLIASGRGLGSSDPATACSRTGLTARLVVDLKPCSLWALLGGPHFSSGMECSLCSCNGLCFHPVSSCFLSAKTPRIPAGTPSNLTVPTHISFTFLDLIKTSGTKPGSVPTSPAVAKSPALPKAAVVVHPGKINPFSKTAALYPSLTFHCYPIVLSDTAIAPASHDAPKEPPTAFALFSAEERPKLHQSQPGLNFFGPEQQS